MSNIESIRKIRSFQEGKPLSRREKKATVMLLDNKKTILLSFVRMGGSAIPWGISLSIPNEPPVFFISPDPILFDDTRKTLANFEETFSKLILHPGSGGNYDEKGFQVFLPNNSHIELLHIMALRYMSSTTPDINFQKKINRLGRICNFLFQEYNRPGQQIVHSMSSVLKEHFTFPADDLRQGHLGFLLALLKTEGTLSERLTKAEFAEKNSIGISLSPNLEKETLKDLVTDLRILRNNKDKLPEKSDTKTLDDEILSLEGKIKSIIENELRERHTVLEEAYWYMKKDTRPRNDGLIPLWKKSCDKILDYFKDEKSYMDNPNTYPFSKPDKIEDQYWAASGYLEYNIDEEEKDFLLKFYDNELQKEAVVSGDAIIGKVVKVEIGKPQSNKIGSEEIFWIIESTSDIPFRLRKKDNICPVSYNQKGLVGKIVEINETGNKQIIKILLDQYFKHPYPQPHTNEDIFLKKGSAKKFFKMSKDSLNLNKEAKL